MAPGLKLWVEQVVGFEKERREGAPCRPASPALEQPRTRPAAPVACGARARV